MNPLALEPGPRRLANFGEAPPRPAQKSCNLRNPRDALLVERHHSCDPLVRDAFDLTQTVDDQAHVCLVAEEILALAQRGELLGGAMQLDVAGEVRVGTKQDDVELLDAALLLHSPAEPDRLVEYLKAPLLASANGRTPANEQHTVGHGRPPSLTARPVAEPIRGESTSCDKKGGGYRGNMIDPPRQCARRPATLREVSSSTIYFATVLR